MQVIDKNGYLKVKITDGGFTYVLNSDGSYSVNVPNGDTLTLPDTTFNVEIDSVLVATETYPTLSNQTINIVWQ
jgi:flagellar basal body rod protein FlgG